MKVFLTFLFFSNFILATPMEPSINNIRSKYEAIKNLEEKMNIEVINQASGQSAEGSKSQVFRLKGEIKEIREEYFNESGKAQYSYFFDNGQLFFVLHLDTKYSVPLMQPVPGLPKPTQSTSEHRFYFEKDKLIKWLNGKKSIRPSAKNFSKRQDEILSSANQALKWAQSQVKK